MSLSELRSDPYAWAFVKQHHRAHPHLRRALRMRRTVQLVVAAVIVAALSVLGMSLLSAGPSSSIQVTDVGGGGITISVVGGSPDQVLGDIRAAVDAAEIGRVRVESVRGREDVAGRVIGDGFGVTMVDASTELDFTATEVVITPDADGVISVVVPGTSTFDIVGSQMTCTLFGANVTEARADLEAAGYRVEILPAFPDAPADEAQFVMRAGERGPQDMLLFAVPAAWMPEALPECGG